MDSITKTIAVILAAGKGVRMKSELPKVLYPFMGRPMVSYVLEACKKAGINRILLVVGHGADMVRDSLGPDYEYVEQPEQLGTGHALLIASRALKRLKDNILVLAGDTPLLTPNILRKLIKHHKKTGAAATMMTAIIDPPPAYGRIIRDQSGHVLRIVEERDASTEEKRITEVNTSHYCFRAEEVFPLLSSIERNNDQKEYYLTDVIHLLVQRQKKVETLTHNDPRVLIGINSRLELEKAARTFNQIIIQEIINKGVTIVDSSSVYIEPDVKIGEDTVIYPFTSLVGKTIIGKGCVIGPQAKLTDARIGDDCRIEFSVVENRKIEKGATIGPFTYISENNKDK